MTASKPKFSQSKKLTLKVPVKWGEDTVEELVLDRPTGKALRKLSGAPTLDDLLKVAALTSDYPDKFFDKLDAADVFAVGEVVGDFLEDGL